MSEQTSVEVNETLQKDNLLDGSILIHGFMGNLQDVNPYAEEVKKIKKILTKGAVVSPSQREHDEREKSRYRYDAPFDLKRVSFHVWKGDGGDEHNYIGDAFFATPVASLEGYVPTEDPAFSARTVSAYGKEGVNISLDKGKLFMDIERFMAMRDTLQQVADQRGMNFKDYVNKYLVILPHETFINMNYLWNAVISRIEPSTGVVAHVVTAGEMKKLSSRTCLDFTEGFNSLNVSKKEDLGKSNITEGNAVSRELAITLKKSWKDRIGWLGKVKRNLKTDPYEIENMREKSKLEEIQEAMEALLQDDTLLESHTLRQKYNYDKRSVIEENEKILEEMFPNAPLESEKIKAPFRLRQSFIKPRVVRRNDGKIHVIKPDFV